MSPVGRPGFAHWVARVVDYLFSRSLTPAEQLQVAEMLNSDREHQLFWSQPAADQRHGLTSARRVAGLHPGRRDLIRAALLHDVGKRHARLGLFGRTWASLVLLVGGRMSQRVRLYHEHGTRGAEELAAAGAGPMVVSYAYHHHGPRPPDISHQDWEVLNQADRASWKRPGSPGWGAYPKARGDTGPGGTRQQS